MRLLLESKSVELALQLATVAHKGQVDKAGADYIMHPIAVAEGLDTEEEQTTALLHDIVEDTQVTLDDLIKLGFSERIVSAVECLTHREGEPRKDYLMRISENVLAVKVKLSDLAHNSDLTRIAVPSEKDYTRIARYAEEIKYLHGLHI